MVNQIVAFINAAELIWILRYLLRLSYPPYLKLLNEYQY
jgi:hypothetical protein